MIMFPSFPLLCFYFHPPILFLIFLQSSPSHLGCKLRRQEGIANIWGNIHLTITSNFLGLLCSLRLLYYSLCKINEAVFITAPAAIVRIIYEGKLFLQALCLLEMHFRNGHILLRSLSRSQAGGQRWDGEAKKWEVLVVFCVSVNGNWEWQEQ